MKKQVRSLSGITYKNGLITLRGAMATKVMRWSKKLGVTPEQLCNTAWREGFKPENWPTILKMCKG